jgi:hypothetical protein
MAMLPLLVPADCGLKVTLQVTVLPADKITG